MRSTRALRDIRFLEVHAGGGQHQLDPRAVFGDTPRELKPVDRPGQLRLRQQDLDFEVLVEQLGRAVGIKSVEGVEARFLQDIGGDEAHERLVFDNQGSGPTRGRNFL